MWLKTFLFAFSIIFMECCYAHEISPVDASALENFFRVLVGESEAGFVLYGKKPVCIHGFAVEDYFYGECEHHQHSAYLRQGAVVWEKLHCHPSNIVVHIYNGRDSLVKNCIHILVINQKLFLDVVQQNITLFQYVLGPDVTPQGLLGQLKDPNNHFHSVLKNDKVLIGILLGYGTQNALYVSRIEHVEEALLSAEHPPFKSQLAEDAPEEFKQRMLLSSSVASDLIFDRQPSFGYDSLQNELQALSKKIEVSSLKLARKMPSFIFGRLKEGKEDTRLIRDLEATQDQIKSLLSSKQLLRTVLSTIFPEEKFIIDYQPNQLLPFSEAEIKQLPALVAANIWKVLENENEVYREAFFEGMVDAEKNAPKYKDPVDTLNYELMGVALEAKQNIEVAEAYFDKLDKDPNFVSICPGKLYYKSLKEGSGRSLDEQTDVVVHYTIKTPDDEVLADTWVRGQPVPLNLGDVISGFALGMKGMKIKEIREVYIHPSLAYGIYTPFDKGIYLKATLQLMNIGDSSSSSIPEFAQHNLTLAASPTIESEYKEQSKLVGYQSGYRIWQHYKKDSSYQMLDVKKAIDRLRAGEKIDINSETSQELLSRLHWNIYHKHS